MASGSDPGYLSTIGAKPLCHARVNQEGKRNFPSLRAVQPHRECRARFRILFGQLDLLRLQGTNKSSASAPLTPATARGQA
jgi:hypothetical protein